MTRVLVAGPLRSGTSLVASMLHYMGCPMVITMMAPVYPRWRAEWEDVPVSYQTHEAFPLGTVEFQRARRQALARWMHDYMNERRLMHNGMAAQWSQPNPPAIGAKSPLFLFAWEELKVALPKIRTVIVHRSETDTTMSIANSYPPEFRAAALKTNAALHELAKLEKATLDISYDEIVADPPDAAMRLAHLAGITSEAGVARAAALVKRARYSGKHPALEV